MYSLICLICSNLLWQAKMNKTRPFAAKWMQLGIHLLSEVSQKEKEKYHIISLTCIIWNLAQKNLSTKNRNRLTDIEKRRDCQGVGGSGMYGELGVSRHKILHLEWKSNEVLLYGRELFPISWDRTWWKVVWEKDVYMRMTGPYAVQQKLTQHCKSTMH